MREMLFLLCFFVISESKICPKCRIPDFLRTIPPMLDAPNEPLNITRCLYPKETLMNKKLMDIGALSAPACVYILPLRDDFLKFYYPHINDTYFETFWKENGERCLQHFGSELLGFYNLEKYGNLPTDVLFTCTRGFIDTSDNNREDQLYTFISSLTLAYIHEMEGKPSHYLKRCYDRDTDLSNSHWSLYNCMFAVMNRTFSVGPLSFNSFFVEQVDESSDFSHLENTFLLAQSRQEGCAIAQADTNGVIQILTDVPGSNYLAEGECTGTLNLYGFDLLCCCYTNVFNCLYTASSNLHPQTDLNEVDLKDDQFLCIKGFLNSTSPELKFRGSRIDILTDLAGHCFTVLKIVYDKDYVFNISLTFGAAADNHSQICVQEGHEANNTFQYIKNPSSFSVKYDVTKDITEIVRCCKGNFCNHFGMFDSNSSYAWPKKFQYKMNEDWHMSCGYVPVDIFWNIFKKENETRNCVRSLSMERTLEYQPYLGGRDITTYPLYKAKERKDANFTGIPVKPIFCFYAGIPYAEALNRSGIKYVPRMVFGCETNETFTLPFTPTPDFNFHVHLHHQNILRQLKSQYLPYYECPTTNGASNELLSFLRTNKTEQLIWFPICFAMIYRDTHQTFYRSGACNWNEICCNQTKWIDEYFENDNHFYNASIQRYEGRPYESIMNIKYKCQSQWCLKDEMDARCFFYAGEDLTPAEIVSKLNNDSSSNNISSVENFYPQNKGPMPLSVTVDEITGYDESTYKEIGRKRD
uniref:Uncharacterized protein n=1 Tax=Panagrolaimus sp. PS1159 TaxID=55785 RepID=A0AC35EW63_9BILA